MKDCTTCKYGFVDEQFGFPMCHHPLRFAKDCVDFNMHEEIEEPKKATGIEEKKLPEGLDEAAEKYSDKYCSDWAYRLEYEDAFIAGAKWQKEQMMDEWLKDRDGCFWDGVEEGKKAIKEQMMKDAVEGEVIYDLGGFFRIKSEAIDGAKYKVGSWVKLIIVKED